MKKINRIFALFSSVLLVTACNNDLDQTPDNIPDAGSLTNFEEVLNAAYYYQQPAATPLAVMGDFRADNALFDEEPYPAFDRFDTDLGRGDLVEQFFRPFYANLYKSILSVNNIIENSTDANDIAEAKFLRAMAYFKLVIVFGDVTLNLDPSPNTSDSSILVRQPAEDIYNNVIIPDLTDAIDGLGTDIVYGRASKAAAEALLGKVYTYLNDYQNAETYLADAISTSTAAGLVLEADTFSAIADGSSEIIYSIPMSASIPDAYSSTEFTGWFEGGDPKADLPVDPDLVAAFDAVANDTLAGGDIRRSMTIDSVGLRSTKYPLRDEQDFVEFRLSDVILLYAEALDKNGATAAEALGQLDGIRTRANLKPLDPTVITDVAQAIQDERRLELAFEGHRWFDLVRTGTVDQEMGQTISVDYNIFPIPFTEILASNGVITQNPGY